LDSTALPSAADLRDRKGQVPGLGHVLETGVGEIPAGQLRAAFEQMADAAAGTQPRPVVGGPAEFEHQRREKQRRVGDATGDHNPGAGLQGGDDRLGAEIGFGRHQRGRQIGQRPAVFERMRGEARDARIQLAAADRRHTYSWVAQFGGQGGDALRRTLRVDPPLVRNDARALRQTMRQDGAHARIEPGVVAGKLRVAPLAHLRRRDGGLGHGLEAQVVEVAALGVEHRGFDAVAPPCRAGTDSDDLGQGFSPLRAAEGPRRACPLSRPWLRLDSAATAKRN